MNTGEKLAPIHPGEVLQEEFLRPLGLSQNQLALAIRVPARRINEIVHGQRRITADTAMRLARYFKVSPQFWLGLQMDFDLDVAADQFGERLDQEVAVFSAAAGVRSASVEAATETRLLTLRAHALRRASNVCRMHFYKAFLEVLATRLSHASARLANL